MGRSVLRGIFLCFVHIEAHTYIECEGVYSSVSGQSPFWRTGLIFLAISPLEMEENSPSYNTYSNWITSIEASKRFGVTNDYVSILCRRGLVAGERRGKIWHVDAEASESFLTGNFQKK